MSFDEDEDEAVLINPWLDLCPTLNSQAEIEAAATRIMNGDTGDPLWWYCFLWCSEVAFGKPEVRRSYG